MRVRRFQILGALAVTTLVGQALLWTPWANSRKNFWPQGSRMRVEIGRGEKLDEELATVFGRHRAREAVIEDVLAGRLTLTLATARFDELNRLLPQCLPALRATYPGASDLECARRQLSVCLQRALAQRPNTTDPLRQHWSDELESFKSAVFSKESSAAEAIRPVSEVR